MGPSRSSEPRPDPPVPSTTPIRDRSMPRLNRPSPRPSRARLVGAGTLAVAALALSGCGDNPACVFGPGNCGGGSGTGPGGGSLGSQASLPFTGQWIEDGEPTVQSFRPGPGQIATTTPIVVVFSESMAPDSFDDAITVQSVFDGVGGTGLPVLASLNLVGDGRVLVILPAFPLEPNTNYDVFVSDGAAPRDLTGQLLQTGADGLLGRFTTAGVDPATPQVVATYPADGDLGQGEGSEIVAVFDRAVDPTTVTSDSFQVLADGVDPTFDVEPTALTLAGPLPLDETRVYTWRQVDGDGDVVPFAGVTNVELALSPAGAKIATNAGDEMDVVTATWRLASFRPPLAAALQSDPTDAIGIANLTAGSGNELDLRVTVEALESGDRVGAFLFGTDPNDAAVTFAVFRSVTLDSGPVDEVAFTADDLDLLISTEPLEAIFADGSVAIALRVRRGVTSSPLFVIDTDLEEPDVQDPVLDTTGPELLDLTNPSGGFDMFRSDVRDLVLTGRASETLRAIEVVAGGADNGTLTAPVGSNELGDFIAAPVPLGILDPADPPVAYTITLYDRALNQSEVTLEGLFTQRGAVGPDPIVAGGDVRVLVYDAETLAPIGEAAVMTHADAAGFGFVDAAITDASGDAILSAADGAADGTILSVYADGYERFTFHGLPTARIQVPLRPTLGATGSAAGSVTSGDAAVSLFLPLLDIRLADTRRADGSAPTFAGGACTSLPFGGSTLDCPFGPEPVSAGRLGVQTLISGEFNIASVELFSPIAAIQAFGWVAPAAAIDAGGVGDETFIVQQLLNAPDVPESERATGLDPLLLSSAATTGVDFDDLVDDPSFTGEPIVSVEALVPGQSRAVAVGLGVAFPVDGADDAWTVRTAHAGAVVGEGSLADAGSVDSDLFARAEFLDGTGNRAGQRPRVSAFETLPIPFALFPPGVPQLTTPAPGGAVVGPGSTLEFSDTLLDSQAQPGLYRLTVTDAGGERWVVWRVDAPDAGGTTSVRLPDLADGGGESFTDGELSLELAVFGVPGFDPTNFLWSDLTREYDAYAVSAPVLFDQD